GVAHAPQAHRRRVDGGGVQLFDGLDRLLQEQVDEPAPGVGAHSLNPAACASEWNIFTVSRLNSPRSLPTSSSFFSRSGVTVMMSQPISAAWTMLSSSRGLAH